MIPEKPTNIPESSFPLRTVETASNNLSPVELSPSSASFDRDEPSSLLSTLVTLVKRRFWIALSVAAISAAFLSYRASNTPISYTGGFQLLVEPLNEEAKVSSTLETVNGGQSGQDKLDYNSQITVLLSEDVLLPIVKKIQRFSPEVEYGTLKGGTIINHDRDSKLLSIQYTGNSPEQVEVVLKELSSGFIRYSQNQRNTSLNKGIYFLTKQVESGNKEVTKLEGELEKFRAQYQLFKPADHESKLTARLNEIVNMKQENQLKLASAIKLYNKLQQQLGLTPEEAVVVTTLSEAPVYQDLLKRLRDLDAKIAVESVRFQDAAPVIQSLKEQREKLLPLLSQESKKILGRSQIATRGTNPQTLGFQGSLGRDLGQQLIQTANQISVLKSEGQSLDSIETSLRFEIAKFASTAQFYERIERQLGSESSNLNRLLAARQSLQLESARKTIPWDLISPIKAEDISAIKNDSREKFLAILISLGLGIAVAWLVDKLDPVFRTPEDLGIELKLAWLGTMPKKTSIFAETISVDKIFPFWYKALPSDSKKLDTHTSAVMSDYLFMMSDSLSVEAFFALYLKLKLKFIPGACYVLNITATQHNLGKSTLALNLALVAARAGKNVLLIDVNLRSPQLHSILGLPNHLGLNQLLSSDKLSLISNSYFDVEQLFQSLPQHKNLRVMTTGEQTLDPTLLLGSEKFPDLIQQLRETFSLVILDAPALQEALNQKLTALASDGTIIVANPSQTNRNELKKNIEDLVESQTNILGYISQN